MSKGNLKSGYGEWLPALACFLATCMFAARPSLLWQLCMMSAILASVVALVSLVWKLLTVWKRDLREFVMPLLVLAALPSGAFLGHRIREWRFLQDLPRYNAAAKWAASHAVAGQVAVIEPPSEFADLGRMIHVHNQEPCGLMIDFFWGGGFPVKHIVRRYAPNPLFLETPECRKNWNRGRKRAEHWYELAD